MNNLLVFRYLLDVDPDICTICRYSYMMNNALTDNNTFSISKLKHECYMFLQPTDIIAIVNEKRKTVVAGHVSFLNLNI